MATGRPPGTTWHLALRTPSTPD